MATLTSAQLPDLQALKYVGDKYSETFPLSKLTKIMTASSERVRFRYYLTLSVETLQQLFIDDPNKMSVGMKEDMVEELIKMLYFDYAIDVEVRWPRLSICFGVC